MPFQHRQGQVGAVADAPQIDLLHPQMATQILDVVSVLLGVVAGHGDAGAAPVDPGLLHLLAIPGGDAGMGHGGVGGGRVAVGNAGRQADAALIQGDDISHSSQGHEDGEARAHRGAHAGPARSARQIDDGRSRIFRGRGEAHIADADAARAGDAAILGDLEVAALGVDLLAVAGLVAEGPGRGLGVLSLGGLGQKRQAGKGEAGGGEDGAAVQGCVGHDPG
ncbi:hypothetical protein D3C80_1388440 [compost metagenome]